MAKKPKVIETDQFTVTVGEYVPNGPLLMPSFVEARFFGFDEPDSWARIELRDGVPRIVEIGWRSMPDAREVQSKDVDALDFRYLIDTLYTAAIRYEDRDRHSSGDDADFERFVRNYLHERRTGKRAITAEFLRHVAEVYRANIDHAPTEAVARTFGVKHRQATSYVKEARSRGFLPPTKQGRAKA